MLCEEKQRLLKEYAALVRAYSDAVSEALTLSGRDFDQARERFEALRMRGHEARKFIEQHEQTHGCRSGGRDFGTSMI